MSTLSYNKFNEMDEPAYILCKPDGERIGVIPCTKKTFTDKENDYREIDFSTYLFIDGERNEVYDKTAEMQHVEVPNIGRFVIDNIKVSGESSDFECKNCHGSSEEVLLAQKYLELFYINMGTTGSIDGVYLYNASNPAKSLLHLALEKAPDWSIGKVDVLLQTKQRSFEISRQDIYSFLMNDVSQAFECIFEFDTFHHIINVREENSIGKDTGIIVSYDNLLKSVSVSSSIDNIKTCLTVKGAEDLSIREVNMGYDRIYSIDYFHSLEYMSESLYNAYSSWKAKWNSKVSEYEDLMVQYQELYNNLNYLKSGMFPESLESEDWTEYGLSPLKEKLAVYEQKQTVMIKAGQAKKTNNDYSTVYVPCYQTIQRINQEIKKRESDILAVENQQKALADQMDAIIQYVDMKNSFSSSDLMELTKFIREDELSSSNFVVTDTMTESQRMDMLHAMLEYGQKELAKVSQPTIEFSAEMLNLLEIPGMENLRGEFEVWNYIRIILRDDYKVKARIIEIEYDFMDHTISPTFGNILKRKDGIFADVTEALSLAQSAATSVSFNSSYWNQANKESASISKMLSDGLLAAGEALKTENADFEVDDRGLFVRNKNDVNSGDGVFIGGGQILFTDDDFESVRTALGRVSYTKNGVQYNDFGLLADFVITGYIGGSFIEGNEIKGGTITGSVFNNGNGTFSVDENGVLSSSAGTIGGWTITSNKLYAGDTENGEKVAVIQKPRDGITWVFAAGGSSHSNYGDCPFRVSKDGKLYATNAEIEGTVTAKAGKFGGINIDTNRIYSDNGKVEIKDDGSAKFQDVQITGVQTGSSFGGLSYGTNGTYGNLNNGLSVGGSFSPSGGALTDFNNLVASTITADYITAKVGLTALKADIESLKTDNLSSRIAEIEKITSGQIVADNIKVKSANIQGNITASAISLTDASGNITRVDEPMDVWVVSSYNATTGAILETKRVRLFGLVIPDYVPS